MWLTFDASMISPGYHFQPHKFVSEMFSSMDMMKFGDLWSLNAVSSGKFGSGSVCQELGVRAMKVSM